MRSDSFEIWLYVLFIGACLVIYGIFSKYECYAKTQGMGFQHRWGMMAGCQIEVKPSQWIPLDSYYFKQE